MQELDKQAMGQRIREIRLTAGLRQWELAKLLGTTQSAVHKYEHGVVPEPRRLIELSRIGGTSVEWVLTGRHWENGSDHRERLSSDILNTASMLREIGDDGRARLDEALTIVREALRALDSLNGQRSDPAIGASAARLDGSVTTARLLESACRIHGAIVDRIAREAERRLIPVPSFCADDGAE